MKTITKDEVEVLASALFKQGFELCGYPRVIPVGGEIMPRVMYANCVAYAVAQFMQQQEATALEAVSVLLTTTIGNASQLGAKLKKDGWLKDATPSEAANDLLAKMAAALAAKAERSPTNP